MTIEQYLHGSVDFNLSDENVAVICFRRGISEGANVATLTQRQLDLALADLYMFLVTSSTSSSGDYESDGGWQRQHSSKNVYNRNGLAELAKQLYRKWGEEAPSDTLGRVVSRPIY